MGVGRRGSREQLVEAHRRCDSSSTRSRVRPTSRAAHASSRQPRPVHVRRATNDADERQHRVCPPPRTIYQQKRHGTVAAAASITFEKWLWSLLVDPAGKWVPPDLETSTLARYLLSPSRSSSWFGRRRNEKVGCFCRSREAAGAHRDHRQPTELDKNY